MRDFGSSPGRRAGWSAARLFLSQHILADFDALHRLAHHLLIELGRRLLDVAGPAPLPEGSTASPRSRSWLTRLEAAAEALGDCRPEGRFSACGVILGLGRHARIRVGAHLEALRRGRAADRAARGRRVSTAVADQGSWPARVEARFDDRRRRRGCRTCRRRRRRLCPRARARRGWSGRLRFAWACTGAGTPPLHRGPRCAGGPWNELAAAIALARSAPDDKRVEQRSESAHGEPSGWRSSLGSTCSAARHHRVQLGSTHAGSASPNSSASHALPGAVPQPLLVADARCCPYVDRPTSRSLKLAESLPGGPWCRPAIATRAPLSARPFFTSRLSAGRGRSRAESWRTAGPEAGEAVAEVLLCSTKTVRRRDDGGLLPS